MKIKQSLEKKFEQMLAMKIQGVDIKPEVDTLSKDELLLFKEWIAGKKEEAEERLWKVKQKQRAEGKL